MLTRIAPIRAVAYCTIDPLVAVGRPDADAVALLHAAGHEAARDERGRVPELPVGRAVALVRRTTSASRSGNRSTVRRRFSPMVSPSSGWVEGPLT